MPFDASPPAEITTRDRMVRLRDFLVHSVREEDFNMLEWECGTAACLAGWTCRLFAPGTYERAVERRAGELLGLSITEARELFILQATASRELNLDNTTLPQAIAVLDHYLLTGEINWSVAE